MTKEEKIKKIARHYGYETQSRQCIEEMAELTQAINKFWRKQLCCGRMTFPKNDCDMPFMTAEYENLIEEISDVQIMLEQMKFLLLPHSVNAEYIEKIIEEKLDRQLRRMEVESCRE